MKKYPDPHPFTFSATDEECLDKKILSKFHRLTKLYYQDNENEVPIYESAFLGGFFSLIIFDLFRFNRSKGHFESDSAWDDKQKEVTFKRLSVNTKIDSEPFLKNINEIQENNSICLCSDSEPTEHVKNFIDKLEKSQPLLSLGAIYMKLKRANELYKVSELNSLRNEEDSMNITALMNFLQTIIYHLCCELTRCYFAENMCLDSLIHKYPEITVHVEDFFWQGAINDLELIIPKSSSENDFAQLGPSAELILSALRNKIPLQGIFTSSGELNKTQTSSKNIQSFTPINANTALTPSFWENKTTTEPPHLEQGQDQAFHQKNNIN